MLMLWKKTFDWIAVMIGATILRGEMSVVVEPRPLTFEDIQRTRLE